MSANTSNIPTPARYAIEAANGQPNWTGSLPGWQMSLFHRWVKDNATRGDKWRGHCVDLPAIGLTVGVSNQRGGGKFVAFVHKMPRPARVVWQVETLEYTATLDQNGQVNYEDNEVGRARWHGPSARNDK